MGLRGSRLEAGVRGRGSRPRQEAGPAVDEIWERHVLPRPPHTSDLKPSEPTPTTHHSSSPKDSTDRNR